MMTSQRTEHRADLRPILVAHGTRSAQGVNVVAQLAELVSERIGPTRVAFVDVLGPSPSDVLREVSGPAAIIPAFLAAGYHVRKDIPDHVSASGHDRVTLCDNLGPDPALALIMRDRLVSCGWLPGDHVVMAAAGSSDPLALSDVQVAAAQLGDLIDDAVEVGYVATARPPIADVVGRAGSRGDRVFIASYLLAPGLFHSRLSDYGADGVAEPLGADPRIADVIAARLRAVVPEPLSR